MEKRSTRRLEEIRVALERHDVATKMPDVYVLFVKLLHDLDEEELAAIFAEREACAQIAESASRLAFGPAGPLVGVALATQIRMRGHVRE